MCITDANEDRSGMGRALIGICLNRMSKSSDKEMHSAWIEEGVFCKNSRPSVPAASKR